jgi:hypothetical protein
MLVCACRSEPHYYQPSASAAMKWAAQQCNAMPQAPAVPLRQLHTQLQTQVMMHETELAAATPPSMLSSLETWPYMTAQGTRSQGARPLQHHSISPGVMPAAADENMFPSHCGAAGGLPKFVSNLLLQQPPFGAFTVHDLKWCKTTDNKACSLVAAVLVNRLEDFVQGEETRGTCTLNLWTLRADGQGMLLNKRAECVHAAPKQAHQKKRKLQLPSDKALPCAVGKLQHACCTPWQRIGTCSHALLKCPSAMSLFQHFSLAQWATASLRVAVVFDPFVVLAWGRHRSTQPSCSSAHLHFPASRPTCSQCCCRALLLLRQSRSALPKGWP